MRSFADLDALIDRVPGRIVTKLGSIDFGRYCSLRISALHQ